MAMLGSQWRHDFIFQIM